jgi:hypothetical protein
LYPTNGAAASLETFAAALGSGIEENLQSPQLIQPGMHDMRACWVKLIWVESTFKTEEEKKKRRRTKAGGRWRILRSVERAALMDSAARRIRALPTFLKVFWNETTSNHMPIIRTDSFSSDHLVVCLY